MKSQNILKSLILGVALLLATGAFAETNKGSMQLSNAVTVAGKQLPAGDYSVKWEGTGSNVQVSFLQGKKVVATAPARLFDLSQKPDNDSAVVKGEARELSEIHFGGKKYALAIGSDSGDAAGSSK